MQKEKSECREAYHLSGVKRSDRTRHGHKLFTFVYISQNSELDSSELLRISEIKFIVLWPKLKFQS